MFKKIKITIPDYITVSRFIAAPILFVLIIKGYAILAFILYIIFALSDALDGYVARLLKQVTRFGGMLEALADRFFGIFVVLALLINKSIPLWALAILICYGFIELAMARWIVHRFKIKNYLYFVHRDSIRYFAVIIFMAIGGYVLNSKVLLPLTNFLMIFSIPFAVYAVVDYAKYIKECKR